MKAISNIDRYLMVGIIGLAMILFVAYNQPSILNAFNFADATPNGLLAKLGAILSIVGLLAFFYGFPQSFYIFTTNVLRFIYVIGFGIASYCSENDWQCFFI
ncbi:MAG: hypothetical protein R3279_13930 [Putridiphycobacter sp.]|nr:hypothetical protein [Putridiphycobacter sp.]